EIIHLAPRKIVKLAADRHPFKRTHLAEAVEILGLRFREKDLAVTLYLSRRKRKLTIVTTILHQAIFNKVFRVDLDEITSNTDGREFHFRGGKIRVAGRVNAVSQRHDRPAAAHFLARRIVENAVGNTFESIVVWCSLARAQILDGVF